MTPWAKSHCSPRLVRRDLEVRCPPRLNKAGMRWRLHSYCSDDPVLWVIREINQTVESLSADSLLLSGLSFLAFLQIRVQIICSCLSSYSYSCCFVATCCPCIRIVDCTFNSSDFCSCGSLAVSEHFGALVQTSTDAPEGIGLFIIILYCNYIHFYNILLKYLSL